jgi:hypothetical protein
MSEFLEETIFRMCKYSAGMASAKEVKQLRRELEESTELRREFTEHLLFQVRLIDSHERQRQRQVRQHHS